MRYVDNAFSYTDEDHEYYERHGYRLFPHFLSADGLANSVRELTCMFEERAAPGLPTDQIISAHQQEPWIWELATQSSLLDMVERQCGPDIVLWSSHVLCKEPHSGRRIPWHQDAPYWNVRGRMAGGIWIAFDAVGADNGGMCILPDWHDKGVLRRRATTDDLFDQEIDPSVLPEDIENRKVQYQFPAGGMATHHTMIPHTSEPNASDRWRRVLVLRYMAADADMGPKTYHDYRTGEPFEREAFLVRGRDIANKRLRRSPFEQ
jgi:hypothetical protein